MTTNPSAGCGPAALHDLAGLLRGRHHHLERAWVGLWASGLIAQALAQPGEVDPAWGTALALNNSVLAVASQPDGKLVVGGQFTQAEGQAHNRLFRLNFDGSVDTDFNVGNGANDRVTTVTVQSDGRILVGGAFTQLAGVSHNRIARLEADGSLDASFAPAGGASGDVEAILPLPDGGVLIGGAFTRYDGQPVSNLARAFPDGTLHYEFFCEVNGPVYALAQHPAGSWIIAGDFTTVNGLGRTRLARIGPDGRVDETFDPGAGPNGTVQDLVIRPDGHLIVGGAFQSVGGLSQPYLGLLNSQGIAESPGLPRLNGQVYALVAQGDGKVVVGGAFSDVAGESRPRLMRLRDDGQVDPAFNVGDGPSSEVRTVALLPDGSFVIGGNFSKVNGWSLPYLARIVGLSVAVGGDLDFSAAIYRQAEDAGEIEIEVRRTGSTSVAVQVDYATASGTAIGGPGRDFTPTGGQLTFGVGEGSQKFRVSTWPDALVEDDETLLVTLRNPTGGARLGSTPSATVVIVNDDTFITAGGVDLTRHAWTDGTVEELTRQPDGKLLVSGRFTAVNGVARTRVARLNADGSLDPAFSSILRADGTVMAATVKRNGKIVIGGAFAAVNGVTRNRLAQLNADGTLDQSFDPRAGPNRDVYAVAALANGDVLVGGAFSQYAGIPLTYLARVLEDGSAHTGYLVDLNGQVMCLAFPNEGLDGEVLVGGNFTQVNGVARPYVARLKADGSVDGSFQPAAINGSVQALALDPTGRVLVGGSFSSVFSDSTYRYLCRLSPAGPLDTEFRPAIGGPVNAIVPQPDGKLLVGGSFTTVAGQPQNRLVRLRPDATVDPAFAIGSGANDWIGSVLLDPEGTVIVGGQFTQFNELTRGYLTWLKGSGTAPGGELEFSLPTFRVSEGLPEAEIEVRRTGAASEVVEVDFATANGTATLQDYGSASGRLLFVAGQTNQTFNVTLKPDSTVEEDETVLLTLRNPSPGALLGSQQTATLVLVNDDRFETAGGVDVGYQVSASAAVYQLVEQADGKTVVAGEFTFLNGETRLRLARLNNDGTLDPTFNPGLWVEGTVHAAAVQADGKILFGGSFTRVNGQAVNRLGRLNPDGTLDATMDVGAGPNSTVWSLALLDDGTYMVGGAFDRYGGTPVTYLARVYWDGSLDTTYTVAVDGTVRCLIRREGNQLLIGGSFNHVNGVERTGVARLLADGTVDNGFVPARLVSADVSCLLVDRGGGVLVGGGFSLAWGDSDFSYLCRLTAAGPLDFAFRPRVNGGAVRALGLQGDDKLILGGEFTTVAGQPRNRLARLRADGSLDPAFDIGSGVDAAVRTVVLPRDGSVLVGGSFTAFNGLSRPYVARLAGVSSAWGGELEFSAATYPAREDAGEVEVEVRRNGNNSVAIEVEYTTANGTATAPDYLPASGRLLFGEGEVSKTFRVAPKADTLVEDDETVLLTLRNPQGGAVLGSQRTSTVAILDDDELMTGGALDPAYPARANGAVHELTALPDGGLLVAGAFTAVNDLGRVRVARLNADGTLNPAFNPSLWANDTVSTAALQPDGRILIGGAFTSVSGVTRNRLARLHPDGSVDTSFDPGEGPNAAVYALAVSAAGDMLVGGAFTRYRGQSATYLMRLLEDGTLDTRYVVDFNAAVMTLALAAGGQAYVAGDFTLVSGVPRFRLARLQPDGSLDAVFAPPSLSSQVNTVVLDRSNRVMVGGTFNTTGGDSSYGYLCRLTPEGPLDYGFRPRVNGPVNALVLQADGKLILAGSFSAVSDQPRAGVARLLTDGSLDSAFEIGTGANSWVGSVVSQTDGAIVIGGNFTSFNGLTRPYLTRLKGSSGAAGGEFEFASAVVWVNEDAGLADIEVKRSGTSALPADVEYLSAHGTATLLDYAPASGKLPFAVGEVRKHFAITLKPDLDPEDNETVLLTLRNPTGRAVLGSQRAATLVIANDDVPTGEGAVDLAFATAANGPVHATLLQPDGKAIVGGDFLAIDRVGRRRAARLDPNGGLDAAFLPGLSLDGSVEALALASDGRIFLGGAFVEVNGMTRNRIARLEADGALDESFDPGPGANSTVHAMLALGDGGALVGGRFTAFGGESKPYVAKVLADGSPDLDFTVELNGVVYALCRTPDGGFLLGGAFTSASALACPYLVRLNQDLSPDATFGPSDGPNGTVSAVTTLSDGRILIGGSFTRVDGTGRNRVARLLPDGTLDTTFDIREGANDTVQALALQPDGGLLVGGRFTTFAGQPWNRLVRLDSAGMADRQFAIGSGADAPVWTIQALADGGLIVGGEFTQFNGLTRERLVRLQGSRQPPAAFRLQSVTYDATGLVRLLLSGREGQRYVMQVSSDLLTWLDLSTNTAPAAEFEHLAPTLDPRTGFYRTLSVP